MTQAAAPRHSLPTTRPRSAATSRGCTLWAASPPSAATACLTAWTSSRTASGSSAAALHIRPAKEVGSVDQSRSAGCGGGSGFRSGCAPSRPSTAPLSDSRCSPGLLHPLRVAHPKPAAHPLHLHGDDGNGERRRSKIEERPPPTDYIKPAEVSTAPSSTAPRHTRRMAAYAPKPTADVQRRRARAARRRATPEGGGRLAADGGALKE